ncbi:MAG TPA: non-ribosomal peptide synthase/polyketide synthase [Pyrinomonadaceae bacterium]
MVELLCQRALESPDRLAYTFLADGETEERSLTYGELNRQARAIGALLQSLEATGERALLLYPPGPDYIAAFFGCLYAGVIAVPAYPPRLNLSLLRLQAIAEDAEPTLALTTAQVRSKAETLSAQAQALGRLRWLATETLDREMAESWQEVPMDGNTLAYLQYTSGSTGQPKGVMVSHANVLRNSAYIDYGFEHTPDSISLTWLPHFHDMGLIDGIIQPLYKGFPSVLMPPVSFLQRPIRWLRAISRYHVTHSGGPNFAYDLCVRKVGVGECGALDLSSWSVAYNGAEPVRKETLARFSAAFAPFGFRPDAFYPAYGLAEATLKVTGGRRTDAPVFCAVQAAALEQNRVVEASEDEQGVRTLVGSGHAALETKIVIVDPESLTQCAPGRVGEIWVSGPGVAQGYWSRPEETARTFQAYTADTAEGPFLRTGDLGFLKDGELFVTGRLKDLIIIRGANHYPQDIERTMERSHAALRPGCGVAFSIELAGEERLVLVQEVETRQRPHIDRVIETIRQAVAEEHELQPHAVILIRSGRLPKTSSGKLQRHACRAKFLAGKLDVVAEWQEVVESADETPPSVPSGLLKSPESIQTWLAAKLAAKLRVNPGEIDINRPIACYGLDSLMAIELMYGIEASLGVTLPMVNFLQSPSVAQLAAQAMARLEISSSSTSRAVLARSKEPCAEHPLSRGQQALWFLHRMEPESAAYNIASAVRIRSDLNVPALRCAFQALVDRHPSLRTTFTAIHGEPVQRVHDYMEVSFHEEDASAWNKTSFEARLIEEAHRPFDLEQGPLLRVRLFTRSTHEHVLLLVVHHIVADLWSLAVLLDELRLLYTAKGTDTPSANLAPLELQYTDYVRWQEEMLQGAEGASDWAYWEKQLTGELPVLELPADRPRPPVQTYRGASQSVRLSAGLTAALKTLGQQRGATLYMTLLAAFYVLLHRYTGQEDILVGSPTAGRGRSGLAGLVGYFVNPLVMRARLFGNPTFETFLDQVRRSVLAGFEHQDFPFALLVERLQPVRDPSRSPLFQTMFVLQKAHLLNEEGLAAFALGEAGARMKLGELELESVALDQRAAQFDLTLTMAEADDHLAASFEYNTDLFEAATIRRMLRHFQTLLEGIVTDPGARLSSLPVLTASERHQLLCERNDTKADYPQEQCVHQLFEAQVERTPEAVAIICEDEQLTYGELNRRANQLAHYLRRLGVGPEVKVSIRVERSIEMLVGLLGILKAGGAYVPLDPKLPPERLSFILEDAQVKILLTQQQLRTSPPETDARVVCLDTVDWGVISREREENPASEVTPDHLAYVIYTSGSTGTPKGVMIQHRSLVSYITTACVEYQLEPNDRVLQFSSISFDTSAEEIYPCLARGATLVLRADSMMDSTLAFLQKCEDWSLTVLDLPTSYWHELTAGVCEQGLALPSSLRLVIIGGERALPERLATWKQCVGQQMRLVNTYGPTEATIVATMCDLSPAEVLNTAPEREVPIGRAIRNTQVYLLDQYLEPVPVGVPGELYIGGVGLARGYLNRAELTAERFIPDPFSGEAGARLYQSGDLARYLPSGEIEFLGRIDQQVKVRGFRVELGEIEATLSEHEAVREAAVLCREDAPGEKRLVAYLVARREQPPTVSGLRKFLKQKLTEYMMPSAFVMLEAMPTTTSGKIDRRALPASVRVRPELDEALATPRTITEKVLADIWARVLGIEQVGIHDNFFELGGDSILSIQIIARANEAGLRLTPKQLFQHQTIAELAAVASTASATRFEQGVVAGRLPLTPIQHWFFEQHLADAHYWNQALLLEARRPLDPVLLEQVLTHLLLHHDALRLRFVREGSGWQQFNAGAEKHRVFSRVDLSSVQETEQWAALEAAAAVLQSSLNLSEGPLVRVALFDFGAEKPSRLLLVIHHLAVDGVSWRILIEDLQTAYRQLSHHEAIELTPKTTSFKRWAERLTEYARSTDLQEELSYWLAEARAQTARLPLDHSEGANTEGSARTVSVSLNVEETRALLQDAPAAYHTQINDLLLTALAQAFTRWTGARSLLVDLEGHGREEIREGVDLSRTVGWFTTTFPVVLTTEEPFDPGGALKSTKEQLRRIPNRGIGYGLLRYLSGDAKATEALRALAQAEVSFNYLGQFDQVLSQSELFKVAHESSGAARSARANRSHLLEINGRIVEGRLRLDWTYSENIHERGSVESLAHDYLEALRSLILHCQSPEAGGYTPSDFPLANLDQQRLDRLVRTDAQIEDIYPLSPMQHGMLFHSLYAPESGVYVEQLSFILRKRLNVTAFKRAWQQVVDRHLILRTSLVWDELDDPLQVVHRSVRLSWEQHDWRGLSETERQERLEIFLEEDRRRGFDLSTAPLMRLTLIRIGEGAYQMVWSHHHLLLDGWCLSLLLKEVFAFYEAFSLGQDLRLKRSRPYRDYIAWLRQQNLSQAETFWREALKGFTAPTPLVVDRVASDSSEPETIHGEQQVRLSADATARLQRLSRASQLTLNTLVQGAWALLLARYSGEEDVVFGSTVSGRPAALAGVEEMVGLFINTLPVRAQVAPADSLLSWLKKLQAWQTELRQYEYSPLVEVQGWSEVPRGLPLFESILVFENYPVDASALKRGGDLEVRQIRSFERTNYPLAVMVAPGSELLLKILYDGSRFDGDTISRMLGHFQTLLEGIVAAPEARLSSLPLLTEAERSQLLYEWNDTDADYPRDQCIHQLFEAQTERAPDSIAVIFGEKQLTYRELNCRANQLAHHLRALGVGPESHVGILLERSVEMVVGLLGILKAGGAYVPLDPTYPKQRLTFMLEDAQVPVLLTQQARLKDLPEHGARTVCLDADWSLISQESALNPVNETRPDNLAYLIYTSGSTGKPKGVAIPHEAVNRLVFNTNYVKLEAYDRVAQVSNASFDAATFEIWGALLHGAQLIGITTDVALSPRSFGAQLWGYGISVLFLTTALFNQVASEAAWAFKTLRTLLFGGEAVDPKWVQTVLTHGRPERLLHVYGPTESTTFTSWHLVEEVAEGTTIPIGRPLTNTQIYLLDEHLQPVPIGIPGELYIGGNGLARGYLNRPELTASRFLPHPWSREPGARLYRTGDLARYLPGGEIEFVGRLDHQVKIRGFRIELEEIEAVLSEHEAVRETVVVARDSIGGEKRLVAYVIGHCEQKVATSDLRRYLKERLPEHMVPSAFVVLDALPLTPNGKVNRRALPVPERTRPLLEDAFIAPHSLVEDMLAGIWAQVLDLEQIGIHDNFFELGGHSLTATQVMSRLREAFQIEMPLRKLFESPTVAGLTKSIEEARLAEQGLQSPPLLAVARDTELPLSFAQQRLWFLDQLAPGSASYNISGAVHLKGRLDVAALEQSFNEIVRRHESLRTSFALSCEQPIQIIAPDLSLTLTPVDLTGFPQSERETEARRMMSEAARTPFNLARSPLLRGGLLRLAEEEHVLVVVMHHIVSDGWSIGVLLRELATLYEAFLGEKQSPLPELPVQYADFARWQREWLDEEVLEAQLAYWKRQLGGSLPVLALPADRPRPSIQSFRGASQSLVLPKDLSKALKALSRREGVTLFMTLLAAFKTLLYRYTDQDDILVGTPIANRNRVEIEGLIGFFVNTLVLRTRLSGDPSFRELLGRVKEVALSAYARQDLPFEKLVEEIQPERSLSHAPLFQVMFVLQNSPVPALELPGLKLSPVEVANEISNFDLTLVMEETEQGLTASLDYSTDLFDDATIRRTLRHFQSLLEGIVAAPEARLSSLSLLTEAERHQVLYEWNDTRTAYPTGKCIHHLFEEQVERTPHALALMFEEEQVTYAELNHRANQLAHHLQSLGVGPEARVGLCVERSVGMVVGLLGILKAGGAYVPLDPMYPKERLTFMLEDAQIMTLVTERHARRNLPSHSARVICLNTDWEMIAAESALNPTGNVTADNLAYVIYTSGSTGKPKGALLEHRGLCNLAAAQARAFDVRPGSRVLQFASLSFDASVSEIFMALPFGATLCLEAVPRLLPGSELSDRLRERAITIVTLPPLVLAMLAGGDFPDLQTIIVAGETCSAEIAAQWSEGRRFFNAYGPTETTVCATIGECLDRSRNPPIGRPLANTQVYLLDQHLQPVPVGVPGELFVGGVGLARGYLNRAGLTAERFVPHPFSKEPGARLYRSGDLARYLPNGEIEFLGRIDHQVKVRGFRVELGEIEATLSKHEAVREAVVLARETALGEKRLVAYVVVDQEQAPSVNELRGFLKEKLLEHMMPSAFIVLDALPLTSNGKVDRQAFPDPEELRPRLEVAYRAPQTELEQTIAKIWQEALHVEQVGVNDNFFDLGGHSLLMAQVHNKLRETFKREISLIEMFKYPTVRSLAEYLSREQTGRPVFEKSQSSTEARRESIKGLAQLRQKRRAVKSGT